jgi:hypothetical protein
METLRSSVPVQRARQRIIVATCEFSISYVPRPGGAWPARTAPERFCSPTASRLLVVICPLLPELGEKRMKKRNEKEETLSFL